MTSHFYTFVNKDLQTKPRQNTALFHNIIQRLIINNYQPFNICQQEYYLVTVELKCHQNIRFFLYKMWIRMCHARHNIQLLYVTLPRVSGDRT